MLSYSLTSKLSWLLALQLLPSVAQEWGPHSGRYVLVDDYNPSNFFSLFNFSTEPDYRLSQGFVQWENHSTATDLGLVYIDGDTVHIGVDYKQNITIDYNVIPPAQWYNQINGRPSVYMISYPTYQHGLFVFDVQHMPVGCGVWPALWTVGRNVTWPTRGEIDVMENANNNAYNTMTLHTTGECLDAGVAETGYLLGHNCSADVSMSGCGVQDSDPRSAGDLFNDDGGGVFAMEWTSQFIRVWFFPRGSIPSSITNLEPDPNEFGPANSWELPAANFMAYPNGSCPIDEHFIDHNIIIDIDFCGNLAGNSFCNATCSSQAAKDICAAAAIGSHASIEQCAQFVAYNPEVFVDAYFEINSIKVYQQSEKLPYIGPWPTTTVEPVFTSWYHPGHGGSAQEPIPTIPPGYEWEWNPPGH